MEKNPYWTLRVQNFFYYLFSAFNKVLFPPRCRACGEFFRPSDESVSRREPINVSFPELMAPFLCPECGDGFRPVDSPLCPVCGEVFHSRVGEDHLCGRCIQTPRKFSRARAVGIYEKGLLKAVHCLKYKGRAELARPLGRLLFAEFRKQWRPEDIDLVLPVPLHPVRMRRRGFNQSLLLISQWPELIGAAGPEWQKIETDPAVMKRSKRTQPQTGLAKADRLKNLKGAFVVSRPESIENRRILLVDDVYTTGATADACAGVLLAAGAARVDVLTLARTLGK